MEPFDFKYEDDLKKCSQIIKESRNTMVLTGAGMSTESGIPDFRSANGLYKNVYRAEEVLSHEFFYSNTDDFYDFLKKYLYIPSCKANVGHDIIAKWEKEGYVQTVATQNIDGLHQMAGSKNVIEMHGTMRKATCMACGKKYDLEELLPRTDYFCNCNNEKHNIIKPDIVLYGEAVPMMQLAFEEVQNVDLLIILGTSLVVYPVAALPTYLKKNAKIIIINYSHTQYEGSSNCISINAGIGDTLTKIDSLL